MINLLVVNGMILHNFQFKLGHVIAISTYPVLKEALS